MAQIHHTYYSDQLITTQKMTDQTKHSWHSWLTLSMLLCHLMLATALQSLSIYQCYVTIIIDGRDSSHLLFWPINYDSENDWPDKAFLAFLIDTTNATMPFNVSHCFAGLPILHHNYNWWPRFITPIILINQLPLRKWLTRQIILEFLAGSTNATVPSNVSHHFAKFVNLPMLHHNYNWRPRECQHYVVSTINKCHRCISSFIRPTERIALIGDNI
jgi:hypothetical protein